METTTSTLSRRSALKGIGAVGALALAGSGGVFFSTTTPAGALASQPGLGTDTVLLTVFLRGAADGLNIVIPVADSRYHDLRPTIGRTPGLKNRLDSFFSLNDDFGDVMPLYEAGDLAFIQAIGSPASTRSHFSAMDNMDTALAGPTGWLWRANEIAGHDAPFAGVGIGTHPNPSLTGLGGSAPSIPSVDAFLAARQFDAARRARLTAMYAPEDEPQLNGATLATTVDAGFDVLDAIGMVPADQFGANFEPTQAGQACLNAVRLIRADIGIRAMTIDIGGNWDHHSDEMSANKLPKALKELGAALAALRLSLGADFQRTTTLVVSEFGRTVKENGSKGTDHGTGTAMMVLGPNVRGGQVFLNEGVWPGLMPADLVDGQDLQVTTDFRQLFADAVRQQFGEDAVGALSMPPGVSTAPIGVFENPTPLNCSGEWIAYPQTNLRYLRLVLEQNAPPLRSIDIAEEEIIVEVSEVAANGPWQPVYTGGSYPLSSDWQSDWLIDVASADLARYGVRWATVRSDGSQSAWIETEIAAL